MNYTITGGVCSGYRLCHRGEPMPQIHFANMWDAILTRDALNRGEWIIH